MSLVKLTDHAGNEYWVNAKLVREVRKNDGEEFVRLWFDGNEYSPTSGTLDEVAEKLNRFGG